MTNEDTEALEKQILQWIKNRHVKQISVLQYMREHKLDENLKEKYKLLGALKDFQRLKRDYVIKGKNCCLMLQIV